MRFFVIVVSFAIGIAVAFVMMKFLLPMWLFAASNIAIAILVGCGTYRLTKWLSNAK